MSNYVNFPQLCPCDPAARHSSVRAISQADFDGDEAAIIGSQTLVELFAAGKLSTKKAREAPEEKLAELNEILGEFF